MQRVQLYGVRSEWQGGCEMHTLRIWKGDVRVLSWLWFFELQVTAVVRKTEDLLKSVYFFVKIITRYESCFRCGGSGRANCETCHGTSTMKGVCTRCDGSGRYANCAKCNGRRSVTCPECKGAGRFEGQWVKSLQSWPVDRLRFEIDKRQREISNLYGKVSYAEQELRSSNESYERAYACRQPDFDASGYNRYNTGLMNEIDSAEGRIKALQEELNAIEQVLNTKWK